MLVHNRDHVPLMCEAKDSCMMGCATAVWSLELKCSAALERGLVLPLLGRLGLAHACLPLKRLGSDNDAAVGFLWSLCWGEFPTKDGKRQMNT